MLLIVNSPNSLLRGYIGYPIGRQNNHVLLRLLDSPSTEQPLRIPRNEVIFTQTSRADLVTKYQPSAGALSDALEEERKFPEAFTGGTKAKRKSAPKPKQLSSTEKDVLAGLLKDRLKELQNGT